MLYRRRTFIRNRRRDHRRSDDDRFAAHFGSRRSTGNIEIRISFESKALHRLATNRTQLIVTRTFVDDHRVIVSNVRDVGRLIDNRHVPLGRKQCLLDSRRAKFAARDERILVGTNVVITVRPIPNSGALIETRFRRQRRPANIIIARSPRDPRRRPLVSRHPNPADPAQPSPAPVVISRPTERFFRNPGPACVGISPLSVGVGAPPIVGGFVRTENITIVISLDPIPVRLEPRVKGRIRIRRLSCRLRPILWLGSDLRRGRGSGFLFFLQHLFARVQICFALYELLCLLLLMLSGQSFLDLFFNFCFSLFFGLLFLTSNEESAQRHDRDQKTVSHRVLDRGVPSLFESILIGESWKVKARE